MERDGNGPEPDLTEPAPSRWITVSLEDANRADMLLRQAHIAKTRGEADRSSHMVAEAYQQFPHYPAAILAYVDELLDRGRAGDAVRILDEAVATTPPNLALEDKRAELVLRTRYRAPIDLDEAKANYASGKTALWLSVLLPGLGHMAMENYQRGAWIMAAWLVGIGGVFLVPNGVPGLAGVLSPHAKVPFNPLVLLPILIALAAFAVAVSEMSHIAKQTETLRPTHPVPPENLPFE